ncbi:glycoside hydrolase family 25 protein [Maricaulis sp. CAU 1757]
MMMLRRPGPELTRRDWLGGALAASGLAMSGASADSAAMQGVDASHFNGPVDWTRVARAGIGFAYLKASEGTGYRDPRFELNRSAARAAGLLTGAYHVFRPDLDAGKQAQFFLSVASSLSGGLVPMLDIERATKSGARAEAAAASLWLEHVAARLPLRHRKPGVYIRRLTWQRLGQPGWSGYPLWLADWTATPPLPPAAWESFALWQYSASGAVAGFSGAVDRSVAGAAFAALRL